MSVKVVFYVINSLGTVLEPYRVHTEAFCGLHSGVAVIEEKSLLWRHTQAITGELVDARIRLGYTFLGRIDHDIYLNGVSKPKPMIVLLSCSWPIVAQGSSFVA